MIEDDVTTVPRQSDSALPKDKDSTETSDFGKTTNEKAGEQFKSWVGRTLNERYLLKSILGKGGFGIVFRAVDAKLNRAVVVKVLLEKIGTTTA